MGAKDKIQQYTLLYFIRRMYFLFLLLIACDALGLFNNWR